MSEVWGYRDTIGDCCNCIGPQRGEPYCPCLMRDKGVFKRNERWIQPEQDLGPVQNLRDIWENMK